MLNIDLIKDTIESIDFVENLNSIEEISDYIIGNFTVAFEELDDKLEFEFNIYPQYPLQFKENETIKFINKDLLEYNHVMECGSICIHTTHNTDLKTKILLDFNSLKQWIIKYYINKSEDSHYEHIITPAVIFKDKLYSYIFTQVDGDFFKGDFGIVNVAEMSESNHEESTNKNHFVRTFKSSLKLTDKYRYSKWSKTYLDDIPFKRKQGIYYFLGDAPAKYNRFIYKNWLDFKGIVSESFFKNCIDIIKRHRKAFTDGIVPVFFGYNTIESEVHWQVALINLDDMPFEGVKNPETKQWETKLLDKKIIWGISRDSSYKYFFGRGALCEKIFSSKILIIGVGAVGSSLATTLTRGGCKRIDILDYDIKEPENVCRSEYTFQKGIGDKIFELRSSLIEISPFIDIQLGNNEYFDLVKEDYNNLEFREDLTKSLNKFDIIFDCTTDNDLMYILNEIKINADVINLSITNHANELVCAFSPNIYQFVNTMFSDVLDNDLTDLYEPTGCWSPTFKASYNDINMLLQVAIKQINMIYNEKRSKNNFLVEYKTMPNFEIKVKEF